VHPIEQLFGWETGLRLGDICQLEWSCFDRPHEVIVWTDKRNKRVAVPVSPELSLLLTGIPVQDDGIYLFPEQRATLLDPDRRAGLSVYFKRHCERAGIKDKSFHSLRHAFVQTHREHGETWKHIAQAIGHSCEETTKGYANKKVGGRK
jgi:integrase